MVYCPACCGVDFRDDVLYWLSVSCFFDVNVT